MKKINREYGASCSSCLSAEADKAAQAGKLIERSDERVIIQVSSDEIIEINLTDIANCVH
jgi:hypothetical protein